MRVLLPALLLLLTGCHSQMRVGSPQLNHSPYTVTCIIVIGDKQSEESMKAAADICKDAIEKEKPRR